MWFSSGNIFEWNDTTDPSKVLHHIMKLPVDGVELTFARTKELFAFSPDKHQIAWLKGRVGIHAPMVSRFDESLEGVSERLDYWSKKLNARYVVFHPTDMPDRNVRGMAVENLSPRWKIDIDQFERIAGDHKIVIDVSHAVQWGRDEIKKYVERFYDRITAVHFSYLHKGKDFRKYDWFKEAILPLKWLSVPVVLERPLPVGSDLASELSVCKELLHLK